MKGACENCGEAIKRGEKVCWNCGQPVGKGLQWVVHEPDVEHENERRNGTSYGKAVVAFMAAMATMVGAYVAVGSDGYGASVAGLAVSVILFVVAVCTKSSFPSVSIGIKVAVITVWAVSAFLLLCLIGLLAICSAMGMH